jgi:hemerythrin-like domain-containing protein
MEFLKVFVDRCHDGKEEEILFPALEVPGISNLPLPAGHTTQEASANRTAAHGKLFPETVKSLR